MVQHLPSAVREDAPQPSTTTDNLYGRAILRCLIYYDLFRFPLRIEELHRFSEVSWPDQDALEAELDSLVKQGLIVRDGPWVHLGDPALVEERIEAEARAKRVMPRARRRSRLIARFPFVRGVALSGTISKGVFSRGDDVDFFVITAPGRLWICRVLLMGFKKVFLLNSRRTFCINYLVTEDHLEVPDHNLFTATEIAWLMPTINPALFDRFNEFNAWVEDFLPQWKATTSRQAGPWKPFGPARLVEAILSGDRGETLDDRCHGLVKNHNLRRYGHMESSEFDLALRTAKGVSKHHPQSLQARILEQFDRRIQEFEERHAVVLR
ncbi:MAG: hypothetical protein DRJ65_09370 [Acidobacteria bacterium]|nr:MAG: hypothetical protein DRJ65_09370 [Acidobacteriota bacterium]